MSDTIIRVENLSKKYIIGHQKQGSYTTRLSKVVHVTKVDIRPLSLPLNTLNFKAGSIRELPFENESIESLSNLCVVEHIGLGRYGAPLDTNGTEKAIAELKRVVKPRHTIGFWNGFVPL